MEETGVRVFDVHSGSGRVSLETLDLGLLLGHRVQTNDGHRPRRTLGSLVSCLYCQTQFEISLISCGLAWNFGGDSDARVGAADSGAVVGELDESGRALDIRGENASDEAVAAGDMAAAQDILDDGDGGGGGMAALGIPDRSTMSRVQWKNFKKKAAKNKGRK